MMERSPSLLVIEDSLADFLLMERHLRKYDPALSCARIASPLELDEALDRGPWRVVLADYNVPGMSFEATLEQVRQRWPDLPVILVSGAVGEERAVELLKFGVSDFILKDNLARLIPAIERCLREADEQRARRAAEAALRESEERLRLALWAADLAMWDWDVKTDAVVCNERWAEMLGERLDDITPSRAIWETRVHPDDLPAVQNIFASHLRNETPFFEYEYRLRHRAGHWIWVLSKGKVIERDAQSQPLRACGANLDISERKRLEMELRQMAMTDPLTSTFNRRYLLQMLEKEISRTQRYARPSSLIMFDIDHFKRINDAFGHEQGDIVLKGITTLVRQRLRHSDVFARWGGEEFMILAPETTLSHALKLAATLRKALHESPFTQAGRVTASFGVAEYQPGETVDQWLKRVDDLVYQGKQAGRDQISHRES